MNNKNYLVDPPEKQKEKTKWITDWTNRINKRDLNRKYCNKYL